MPWSAASYKAHLTGHRHGPAGREKDIEVSYHQGGTRDCWLAIPSLSFLWTAPQVTLLPNDDADWASAHDRFFPRLADFLRTLR